MKGADGQRLGRRPEHEPAVGGGLERPLAGMRVIELSSFVASPLGGMTLAQLGADVIRIDPIGGGADRRRWPLAPTGRSIYWAELNRGKRSVTVDLSSGEGQALVAELVKRSGAGGGIVLTNAGPRTGLSYTDLRAHRSDLIYVELQGSRDGGTAVDYVVNASSGFPFITGPDGHGRPVNHALPVWDVVTGLYLVVGLLAADRRRHDSGRGELVSVALADVALAVAGTLGYLGETELNGASRPRLGNQVYGTFGADFSTRDGHWVMVVALTPRHWSDLMEVTGLTEAVRSLGDYLGADFADEEARYTHREVLVGVLARWFAEREFTEIAAALAGSSVLWSRFRSFAEVVDPANDAFTTHPMVVERDEPGLGRYHVLGSPLVFNACQQQPLATPVLGQHTDTVLRDLLGLDSRRLGDLKRRRIIGESEQ